MADRYMDEQHEGGYAWRNGAEMEWECSEHCPHPDHDDDHAPRVATRRTSVSRRRDGAASGSNAEADQ